MAKMSGNIGSVTVEVKPTVTLESAEACCMMLNLFMRENDEYALHVGEDGEIRICAKGGYVDGNVLTQALADSFEKAFHKDKAKPREGGYKVADVGNAFHADFDEERTGVIPV